MHDHERAIKEVERRLQVTLPPSLRSLYENGDGRYSEAGQWYVVWPLVQVAENNERAWGDGTLDRDLLAFGDDGTGSPFCVRLSSPNDEVLRWNLIDLEVEVNEGPMAQFVRTWLEN